MRKCDGCESPKDDRRWMSIDGTKLCEKCLDKESAVDEIEQLTAKVEDLRSRLDRGGAYRMKLTAERDDYKEALQREASTNAKLGVMNEKIRTETARRAVEVCEIIECCPDPISCADALRAEFGLEKTQ